MNGGSRDGGRDGGRHRSDYPSRPHRDDRRDRDRDRRQRSRSPHRRDPRRDHDSYSSSRDFREREREDRYRERDRRDDRGWGGRDRPPPRRDDRRRDDYDRSRRPDADLFFEDRGGRHPRDRDHGARRDRQRSLSPKKERLPTPDLTDMVPILQKRRRLTTWDQKPRGYDKVTSETAKMSGMFTLPGAPRQQQMDLSKLQALATQNGGGASGTALMPSHAKQSKQLFVENLPADVTPTTIQEHFNLHMNGLSVVSADEPCVKVHISEDHSYGLVEFRTPEDATVALFFDGSHLSDAEGTENGNAQGFKVERPKEYIAPSPAFADEEMEEQPLLREVVDSSEKLSFSNVPKGLDEEQVMELFQSLGSIKAFQMAVNREGEPQGFGFVEYQDSSATEAALAGLNIELGGQELRVKRACIGASQAAAPGNMGTAIVSMLAAAREDLEGSPVMVLLNMVRAEELVNNEEYADLCSDIRDECDKYGQVVDMKVPRPKGIGPQPGVGKIYIKYDGIPTARKAIAGLGGRTFSERTVVATFFPERNFDLGLYT